MELFKWKIKSNKPIEIVALGDIHLGSPECDIEMLKSVVAKIKKRKCKVLLMGDLIDMGLRESPGSSVYSQTISPGDQVKEIVKILSPIKHQILSSVMGNHCYRVSKSCGIDISEQISNLLGCNYGKYQCINNINVNNQIYNIFPTHGAGSGQTTESRVNSFKKYLEQIESDVLVFGHVHDIHSRVFSRRVVGKNGLEMKNSYMVLAGNLLSSDSGYGEMRGYAALRKGCPLIKLYPNTHKVEVDLNWFE